MFFELWDIETRNPLYDFDTLDEALTAARELTELNLGRYPERMALARIEADHKTTWLARGHAFLELLQERPAV